MMKISRRRFLGAGIATAALSSVPLLAKGRSYGATHLPLPTRPEFEGSIDPLVVSLEAKIRQAPLLGGKELPLWTYGDDLLPIIRLKRGQAFQANFKNALPEHTSIHWHGIRLNNVQDGVPYLTQRPVEPGQSFTYNFTPPDTGTFFFHPHCDTIEQLGRGLAGMMIVEGDETKPYDADHLIVLRDWRLGPEGDFLPMTSDEGASRAGTFGTRRSANLQEVPTLEVPANGDVRLRIANVDMSRVSQIGVMGAEAALIATDGVGLPPIPMKAWKMGPAQRIDLVVQAPEAGGEAVLVDYFAPEPVPLARLKAVEAGIKRRDFDPAPLFAPDIAKPDLKNAIRQQFRFSATAQPKDVVLPDGEKLRFADALCLSDKTFWAINKATWPEDSQRQLPPPLCVMECGRTYIYELINETPHMHPIHIHGHTYTYIKSNKRSLPQHHADTVLLKPKERIEVAFVADNPGDWMFHCHIIEHQETGMMGIVRVA